jgi:hypothetical protein
MQKGQNHQIKLRMKTNDEEIWFRNKELFAHISHSNNRGLESGEMSVFCAKGLCACWPGVLDREWKEPRSPESCQKTTNARKGRERTKHSIGMAIFGPAQKVTREALFHVNAPRADPLLYSPCDRSVVKIAAGRLTAALGPNKDARWRAAARKTKRSTRTRRFQYWELGRARLLADNSQINHLLDECVCM